ncbi:unnamed protein product [Urochloa decumbens]|uniref:Aminotransferase-like plant mobile domain-containing protein n=1 Tax=Urochloa decumbens TaxID=240449 RepID=A0ABC8XFZ0_9POAL
MAAAEQPLVEESTIPIASDPDPSLPCVRPALFLRPRAGDGAPLPAPPGDPGSGPVRVRGIQAGFRGWACVPRRWKGWVDKLRPRYEPLWRKLGILGGVLASTCRVRRRKHERALLQLAAFWSGATGTFVFPWGEATVTLEDVAALAGLPLLGGAVRAPVSDRIEKEAAAIESVRTVLNRSKKKKATFGAWAKHFVERAPEEEEAASAGGGGGDEARDLLEHGAFLAMWLSIFVLPAPPFDVIRREVFPIAARLARGQSVALAPAALASIYGDLSALKHHISLCNEKEPFVSSAPVHILQLWVWERFPQLRPEPVRSPAPGGHDMPRAARWHDVVNRFSSKHVYAVFMSPKEFEWRPYGSCSFFGLQPEIAGSWIRSQDITTSETLLSFARCLHACELVGMSCIELYSPHRVARQLGFDQDIPGMVSCASSDWEKAWDAYNTEAESSAFIIPNHKPGVTVQYAQWWKPYSSACGSAIVNSAKVKEHSAFVNRVKRKMYGVPAANSGKKLRVDTATRGQPPHILAGANIYPSHSSATHSAIRRAAAVPGLVLRSCPPHLRFRAMPATAASGMPQPAPDAFDNPLDHIPLSERLNSITKKRKQQITEGLVKGGRVKCFIPRSASVGSKKEVLHKDVGQALVDAVASTANVAGESSGRSVTKKAQAKCLQQSRDENIDTAYENNSRADLAVSAGSNEAIGAGTKVDTLPRHEDLLISDDYECDKSSGAECAVNAMHVESHMLGAKTFPIRVGNVDTQLIDSRNDTQDGHVLEKVTVQRNHFNIVEISDDDLEEEASKEDMVFDEATSKEDGLGTTHMHLKSPKIEAACVLEKRNEENQLVSERNDTQDGHVLEKVVQGNHFNIIEISDDDLEEEASKEDMVFDEATSKEDELGTMHMHLKSPKIEATCILQKSNEENQLVSERNYEQGNQVMKELMVQHIRDCELGSVPDNIILRQEQYVLTHAATIQTDGSILEGPTEEMHTCIVTGDIGNTDKVSAEENGSLDNNGKGNEDILVSNQDLESPMEDSTGANRKKSGDSERFSSRMLHGNTKLVSSEVCTKTLYYLSWFDRPREAWEKDANRKDDCLPKRAVGTMEMIKKASAIRQAEIAELKIKIHNLKEEILALEAAEQGEPLES